MKNVENYKKEKTVTVYKDILSPDGLSWRCPELDKKFKSPEEMKNAITTFVGKVYGHQGYYSSVKYGRIPLDTVWAYCKHTAVKAVQKSTK